MCSGGPFTQTTAGLQRRPIRLAPVLHRAARRLQSELRGGHMLPPRVATEGRDRNHDQLGIPSPELWYIDRADLQILQDDAGITHPPQPVGRSSDNGPLAGG